MEFLGAANRLTEAYREPHRAQVRNGEQSCEQKYVFPAGSECAILDWLRYCCCPDPRFSRNAVSSLYYDSPGFDLYFAKRNSDYLKFKLRLRWYGEILDIDPAADVNCFLEAKKKIGAVRQKERLPLLLPARCLLTDPFHDARISTDVDRARLELAREAPEVAQGPLLPVILLQYDRHRFVEPQTGCRIALDTNIRCTRINPDLLRGHPPVYLRKGVLEVKGPLCSLPSALRDINVDLTKESFSKYAYCCEYLVEPWGRRQ